MGYSSIFSNVSFDVIWGQPPTDSVCMASSFDSNLPSFEHPFGHWLKKGIFRDDLKNYVEATLDFLRFLAFIMERKSIVRC